MSIESQNPLPTKRLTQFPKYLCNRSRTAQLSPKHRESLKYLDSPLTNPISQSERQIRQTGNLAFQNFSHFPE